MFYLNYIYWDISVFKLFIISSLSRNLWGNGNLNYGANSTMSNAFMGFESGNSGMSSFGGIGELWGSSSNLVQGGGAGSPYSGSNLNLGSGDFIAESAAVGYGRNSGTNVAAGLSRASSNGGYEGAYADIYDDGSFFGDSTWRSVPSELEGSGSFGFGLGNAASDVMTKNSASYVGGYGVTNRQSHRGIAA
ncbi:hypothetical protein CFOL_v3_26125 [Cephalotus follicularis]|uniref:Uncharacterized protein n=1 Tax=Cephalotus follicularis TaxID=3775 RepID=A0A1Q3CR06_CEPFO|nr:hypothetical protein CFOL_v3_26125 [Cephalotus follicularis]